MSETAPGAPQYLKILGWDKQIPRNAPADMYWMKLFLRGPGTQRRFWDLPWSIQGFLLWIWKETAQRQEWVPYDVARIRRQSTSSMSPGCRQNAASHVAKYLETLISKGFLCLCFDKSFNTIGVGSESEKKEKNPSVGSLSPETDQTPDPPGPVLGPVQGGGSKTRTLGPLAACTGQKDRDPDPDPYPDQVVINLAVEVISKRRKLDEVPRLHEESVREIVVERCAQKLSRGDMQPYQIPDGVKGDVLERLKATGLLR